MGVESRHSRPCKYSNQNEKSPLEQLEYSPIELRGKSNDKLHHGVVDGDDPHRLVGADLDPVSVNHAVPVGKVVRILHLDDRTAAGGTRPRQEIPGINARAPDPQPKIPTRQIREDRLPGDAVLIQAIDLSFLKGESLLDNTILSADVGQLALSLLHRAFAVLESMSDTV